MKYVYDCVKPSLARCYITRGRVNASDRKSTSGCSSLTVADQPLPEGERLGVRVVDAEDAHAVLDPEADDVEQRVPQRRASPRSRSRTGRCPGTSSAGSRRTGSCRRGGARNHSGCSRDPRVVGRALEGDVERDLQAVRRRPPRRGRRSPRACRARGGWPCGRPPRAPMAHGLPRSPGVGVLGVVAALAVLAADRVDRRQVEDVEAHLRDVRQVLDDVAKRAVALAVAERAREELVPGAEAGALAVDHELELAVVGRRVRRSSG